MTSAHTLPRLAVASFVGLCLAGGPVLAGTEAPYSPAAVAAAQQQGKPVVLHVTAAWCPVCAKQHPIITKLLADPALGDLQVFDVDFDTQKDLLRTLGVQRQSTLIACHGATERARSTGDTSDEAVRALLAKANS